MPYRGLTIQAVQLEDWKLPRNSPFEPQELYYLADDPKKENNRIEKNKKKKKELNVLLMEQL